jgi:hypothetical protein
MLLKYLKKNDGNEEEDGKTQKIICIFMSQELQKNITEKKKLKNNTQTYLLKNHKK